jgi:rare lipoprotein A
MSLALLLGTGCGPKHPRAHVTPPPEPTTGTPAGAGATTAATNPPSTETAPAPLIAAQPGVVQEPPTATPPGAAAPGVAAPYVEFGIASWYGPPYNNRRGANGEIYDMNRLTAAHRTLPLNTVVRVTNLANERSVVVRITDRGPFIDGRIVDLSLAAARALDLWNAGTSRVKLEVLSAPAPILDGGRWCVQIGAFHDPQLAAGLKQELRRRYVGLDVLQFTGPTGDWLRIRVQNDERARAESVLEETSTPEGSAFLVRLD